MEISTTIICYVSAFCEAAVGGGEEEPKAAVLSP